MYRIEYHNLDGTGSRRTRVYDLAPVRFSLECDPHQMTWDYWGSVTDIPCPCCCGGIIRWAEAGYVPGYRMCDLCGRHFMADGHGDQPRLLLMGGRIKGSIWREQVRRSAPEVA